MYTVFVCIVPVAPMRAEPAHRSEQVSQLLFGEMCVVLDTARDFIKVKSFYDKYEGWCQLTQLEELQDVPEEDVNTRLAGEWVNQVKVNEQPMQIPFGSTLSFLHGDNGKLGHYNVEYNGNSITPADNNFSPENIKKLSRIFLNTPYQWGGRSVFGIDCSGLSQAVFKCMNIKIDRDASQQANQGESIGFLQESKAGDLAFFDNEAGKINHVGILLDEGRIIHASGKVRIDTIDNMGIISSDTGKRTHNLRVIKRIQG